jgi:hypothetical protein
MSDVGVRLQTVLPAFWLGVLLAVAGIATPSAFAALSAADAGKVASKVLAGEAALSLLLGSLWLALDRWRVRGDRQAVASRPFTADVVLTLGALFCTVAGYYAVQPLMADARQGRGALSFAQWHAISLAFYGLKVILITALAWRSSHQPRGPGAVSPPPSS